MQPWRQHVLKSVLTLDNLSIKTKIPATKMTVKKLCDKIDELEDKLKETDSIKLKVVQLEELLENMKKKKRNLTTQPKTRECVLNAKNVKKSLILSIT